MIPCFEKNGLFYAAICACLIGRKKGNVVLLTGNNLILPVKKDFYIDNSLLLFLGVSPNSG